MHATLVSTLVLLTAAAAPPGDVARLALFDQHGRSHTLSEHAGAVVVVMVVDAGRLRQLKPWELAIRERLGDVALLRVADVPQRRGVTRESLLERLFGRVPDEIPILIDMEGRWARAFRLDTAQVNLLVFDPTLHLVHRFRGRSTDSMLERLRGVVLELRARSSRNGS